jgi:hypothetical protein
MHPCQKILALCETAEYEASVTAAQQAVAALLAAGADISTKDQRRRTPLAVAAGDGRPEVMEVLLKHVLQQYKAEQQQQQQQQYMLVLQEAGAWALASELNTWEVFLPAVTESLGDQALHSLWEGIRQQLRQLHQQAGVEKGGVFDRLTPLRMVAHVLDCWTAACSDLAAQRSGITGRLEQLVVGPHQQQQQQQQGALLKEGAPVAASAGQHCAAALEPGSSGGGGRGGRAAPARDLASDAGQVTRLEAAAAGGDDSGVCVFPGQLTNKVAELAAAADAAAAAGDWELFMRLLRAMVKGMVEASEQEPQQRPLRTSIEAVANRVRMAFGPGTAMDTALQCCDALFADWLALRQQRVSELQEGMVAAAKVLCQRAPACDGMLAQ